MTTSAQTTTANNPLSGWKEYPLQRELGRIYGRMCQAMADISPVEKASTNTIQNFQYRSIDDVYNSVHTVLANNKIFVLPRVLNNEAVEKRSSKGTAIVHRTMTIEYEFMTDDGSSVKAVVVGESMDSGDKSCNKCQSTADKVCLLQVFKIPTKFLTDPDAETHYVAVSAGDQVSPEAEAKAFIEQKVAAKPHRTIPGNSNAGEWEIPFGKFKGRRLRELSSGDIESYRAFLRKTANTSGKALSGDAKAFVENAEKYLYPGDSSLTLENEEPPPPSDADLPIPF